MTNPLEKPSQPSSNEVNEDSKLKLTREELERILAAEETSTEQSLNDSEKGDLAPKHKVDNNIIEENEEYFLVETNNYIVVRGGDRGFWEREKGSLGQGDSRYYKVYKEDSRISPYFGSKENAIASKEKRERLS